MPILEPINQADLQGVSLLKSYQNEDFEQAVGHASNKRHTEAFRVERRDKRLMYQNA